MFNRISQRKGDRAVAVAIATFTIHGADVLFPLTESAAYDLVVDFDGLLKRVQVRFSSGKEVGLRRIHSNSKGYVIKRHPENAYDWLYVLNAEGKEFLITRRFSNQNSITPQDNDLLAKVLPKLLNNAKMPQLTS